MCLPVYRLFFSSEAPVWCSHDGYLICAMFCEILNLDEMKSVPMRLFNQPIWADSVGEGAYGSLNVCAAAVKSVGGWGWGG